MDTVFPFGLPGPTAFYLVLYVLTFAAHQALVHYVLAGSLYVAGATIVPSSAAAHLGRRPLAAMLRDWMPFMLSAAITAGVAPLLFVQILYQQQFYTANILLAWRWLIVIPVLIVAFYLLYVIKSKLITQWPWAVRTAITIITTVCIVFVGFCWTANYLLSVSEAQWPDVYMTGELPFSAAGVLLRMLVWGGGAFASMTIVVGWQLAGPSTSDEDQAAAGRSLAIMAIAGLAVALASGLAYLWQADEIVRQRIFGPLGRPYMVLAIIGLIVQTAGWLLPWRRAALRRSWLAVATVGWLASLLSVSVLREIGRLASLDMAGLYARHEHARQIGGLVVFLAFAVVNFAVIGLCVWAVRRAK